MHDRISMEATLELIEKGVFDRSGLSRERLKDMSDSFHRGEGASTPAAPHNPSSGSRSEGEALREPDLSLRTGA